MNRDQYTFLEYCNADVKIDEDPFQLTVKRKNTEEAMFVIKELEFKEGYVKVSTLDRGEIWGLGERFQDRFHVGDGLWAIWNRDRPWVVD